MDPGQRIVVGVTGASGSLYARRLIAVLLDLGLEVHASASEPAAATWQYELGSPFAAEHLAAPEQRARLVIHRNDDLFSPLGSGSFRHRGMLVVPCSARTLGAIAAGLSDNVVTRAADVCLKERRRLVLVVRETPLSRIHLENMLRLTDAGAVILPASPGFYHRPQHIEELVDFVVARALDHFGLEHGIGQRWKDR